jgi:hypothetical protein
MSTTTQTVDRVQSVNRRYGFFERCGSRDMPQCLILYVHGMMSGPNVWKAWHRLIEKELGFQMDAFMFRWQSRLGHKACILTAAKDLNTAFDNSAFSRYRHIFVVAHSAGGLVLKQACLLDFARAFRGRDVSSMDYESFEENRHAIDSSRLFSKIRHINNVAVPHLGGTRLSTVVGFHLYVWIGSIYYGPAQLVDYLARLIGFNLGVGYFKLARQLRWGNFLLRGIERRYRRLIKFLDRADLTYPIADEYLGSRDPVVNPTGRPLSRRQKDPLPAPPWYAFGVHSLNSLLPDVGPKIAERLFTFPDRLQGNATAKHPLLQHTTLLALIENQRIQSASDQGTQVARLIPEYDGTDGLETEASCERKLTVLARDQRDIVITGEPGVGKSTVLRRLTRKLAVDILSGDPRAPFPIYFNLREARELAPSFEKQFISQAQRAPGALWALLEEWWIDSAVNKLIEHQMVGGDRITTLRTWLRHVLDSVPVAVILDGADEFLTRTRGSALRHLKEITAELRHSHPKNRGIAVVLGLRQGFAGTELLPSSPDHLLEIGALSEKQAADFFGEDLVRTLLSNVKEGSPYRNLVLSPLVLNNLKQTKINLAPARLETLSGILDYALEKILENADITSVPVSVDGTALVHWKYMLAILCWCLSTEDASYVTDKWVGTALKGAAKRLTTQMATAHQPHPATVNDIEISLRLCNDSDAVRALLNHSIFVNLRQSYYPTHQEWIDVGVARYLAMCVELGLVEDFARRTFYPTVFVLAGEFITPTTITEPFLRTAFDASNSLLGQFVAGNVAAVLKWSGCEIEDEALRFLFGDARTPGRLDKLPDLAKHVWYSAVLYRAVATRESDRSGQVLRSMLLGSLEDHFSERKRLNLHINTEHMAWCGLHLLLRDQPKTFAFEPARLDASFLHSTYLLACPGAEGAGRSEPHINSLIVGYARAARWLLVDQYKDASVFGLLHYAWMACCALRSGEINADADMELRNLLDTSACSKIGSTERPNPFDAKRCESARKYETIVRMFSDVPKIGEFYDSLCDLYLHPPPPRPRADPGDGAHTGA